MKKLIIVTALAALMSGCYIGKAAFQGEDMKIYPFFGPSATYAADTASEGHATDRQTVALPIEERSRYLSPKGHATDRQKVALPFFRRTTGWLSHAETRRTRSLPVPRSPFPVPYHQRLRATTNQISLRGRQLAIN